MSGRIREKNVYRERKITETTSQASVINYTRLYVCVLTHTCVCVHITRHAIFLDKQYKIPLIPARLAGQRVHDAHE